MATHNHPQTDTPSTMRAIIQDGFGSSDTWQLTDIDRPEINDHEDAPSQARRVPRPWNLA